MKTFLFSFSVCFALISPYKTLASNSSEAIAACKSFDAGEIDAYETLLILDLELDNYSIGINNTAKIHCS